MDKEKVMPSVSVIIPCYNCDKWIKKCLDALELQTYRDFEVICVDDCSTDDTYNVIAAYKKCSRMQIILFRNENNSGPAVSRNRAASIARGRWLAFCDSDDWYDENYLDEMVASALRNGSDIVMCEYRKVYESGKPSEDVHYLSPIDDGSPMADKLVYSKSSLCLLLIEKNIFLSNQIPDLRNGEDIACIPCMEAMAKNISVVKKPLYNYLMRTSSASNKPSDKVYSSLYSAFDHIEKNFPDLYPEVLEYLGIRTVLYGVTINALKAGVKKSEIKKIVSEFTKKYPRWKSNSYMNTFSRAKKIYLGLIGKRMFAAAKCLAFIHMKISI